MFRMKFPFKTHLIIISFSVLTWMGLSMMISSCKKTEIPTTIQLRTDSITDIFYNGCTVKGTIWELGSGITEHGFIWSTSSVPDFASDPKSFLGGRTTAGSFYSTILGLAPYENYFIWAYATSAEETVIGNGIRIAIDPLQTQWAQCYGGSQEEYLRHMIQTPDEGFLITGYTYSDDGNVVGNHGNSDIWIIKLASDGTIEWQRCYGGTDYDVGLFLTNTQDGGYAVCGYTYSNDNDVSGNHGGSDAWILKLNQNGIIEWQNCVGGSGYDVSLSLIQTPDNGFIVAGSTRSNDGDVSGNHGASDAWVFKLDQTGNLIWQKCYGGNDMEYASSIDFSFTGGFIFTGYASSYNGDVSGIHGDKDFWVVSIDQSGNLQWQNCLGGSAPEEAKFLTRSSEGMYQITGYTYSNDGDVSGNHGDADVWVVELDQSGNLVWQRCFGGTNEDRAEFLNSTSDNGMIVTGFTFSSNGDISGYIGSGDFWIFKLGQNKNLEWQKCMGGPAYDYARSVLTSTDGGLIVGGSTRSNFGDVSGNHGEVDFWIVNMEPEYIYR